MSDQFDRRSFITKLALAAAAPPALATARLFSQSPAPPTNVRITALSAGPITHGMAFLDGQIMNGVQVGAIATQTNVLSRYASGAVKHAAVSWIIPAAGSYPLSASTDPGGSLTPINPSASVAFVIGGATYTATLPAFDSSKTRFNGAICRECRYITTPMNGATPHNFLTVIFDVRSYAGGKHRVDIQVGSTKDIAGTNTVTYNLTITVAGLAVYTRSSMEHGSFMRWRKLAFVNLTEGTIVDDTSALEALKAVPTYLKSVTGTSYTFTDNIAGRPNGGRGYDLLRTGAVAPNFGDTGGREDIGLFPRWAALYLAHKTANAKDCTLRHGDLSGSWSTNITAGSSGNPEDLINLDLVPTWSTWSSFANGGAGQGMAWGGQNPDCAHQPNLNFLPWLLTADRWYADQLAFWANYNMLRQPPGYVHNCRNGAQGLLIGDQQRGWAWGVRAIGQAGKWLPDAHPFKAYLATKCQNNLDWCDAQTNKGWGWNDSGGNGTPHPLGFIGQPSGVDRLLIFSQDDTTGLSGARLASIQVEYPGLTKMVIFAPWQYSFMSVALAHLHHLGYGGGLGVLDNMLTVIHNLFTHDPDIPHSHAMMFFPPCAYYTTTETPILLTTWYAVHHLSAIWRGERIDSDPSTWSGGCPPFSAYGAMGRAALALGNSRGIDNAAQLTYLMGYTGPDMIAEVDNVNSQPEWGFTEAYLAL